MNKENVKLIAFYLPQYHPIPENDKWWGKGFTEWNNVSQANPIFPGHYQPHLPADLGYYDLRVPEVRKAQADLAKEYGIHGFCYYHYWFSGKRLLNRPLDEILESREPDYPFCLCWANENWTSAWDGNTDNILMKQQYSHQDDIAHIRFLSRIFKDKRYIRIEDKPLFVIYKASKLPNLAETAKTWRAEAKRLGVGDIYLCNVISSDEEYFDSTKFGFDAAIEFQPDWRNLRSLLKGFNGQWIAEYKEVVTKMLMKEELPYKKYSCVTPSWDNTARRKKDAVVLSNSTPDLYEKWLSGTIEKTKQNPEIENVVFVNAWNEWGEGSHLEPDVKFGRGYLEATKNALENKSSIKPQSNIIAKAEKKYQYDLSIVTIAHNNLDYTKQCIDEIYSHKCSHKYEIIVVNNGSTDSTNNYLVEQKKNHTNFTFITNSENNNYSKANNQGAALAKGKYLVFLNNDTKPFEGWIDNLVETFEVDSSVGIQGGKLLYPNNTIQHVGIVYGNINPKFKLHYHIYLGHPHDAPHVNKLREFQMVTGALLAIRSDLFTSAKGFDETYQFGHEDLDLCMAVRSSGYKVIYNPSVAAYHYESITKKELGLEKFALKLNDSKSMDYKNYHHFHNKWDRFLNVDADDYYEEDKVESPFERNKTTNEIKTDKTILFTMFGWNETGGGTTYPKEVAIELVSRGYRVSVFYASMKIDKSKPAYSIERDFYKGVELFGVYNRPAAFIDPDNPEREINDNGIVKCFNEVLDEIRPDLIHFQNFHGLTFAMAKAANKKGIPSCYTPHNYHMIDPNLYLFNEDLSLWKGVDLIKNSEAVKRNPQKKSFFSERVRVTQTLLNKWINLTLAVSTRQRDLLIEHGASSKKVVVVHQSNRSTDILWNSSELAVEADRAIRTPLKVGFIGGVMPHKGVHILVQAAQAFNKSEVEFHIYGFANEQYLQKLKSKDKKNNVTFHGGYKQKDLLDIARNLDIAVVPSLWEDCAPLVLLELMAMRLPIIAANIGGIPDFIAEGVNGFLYQYDSITALIEKINYCKNNLPKIEAMRKSLSQPHSFDTYVDHIETVYEDLTKPTLEQKDLSLNIQDKLLNKIAVVWEGSQFHYHSLANINRELCVRLVNEGMSLSIIPYEKDKFTPAPNDPMSELKKCYNKNIIKPDIHVRHHWPPNLKAPDKGRWVIIQPWEFGYLPKDWVEVFSTKVDEMWVPSNYVREVYINSGVPADRVFVIPNGYDPNKINPNIKPYKLQTKKNFKFLFVGGSIYRKGIDLLLEAYIASFKKSDDVCLVIKDMGGDSFYKGQTFKEKIKEIKAQKDNPEIEYIDTTLSEKDLAGLYTACNALIHPYRGEGFGMPILEAMGAGMPVIVTNGGACLDFCNEKNSILIDAQKVSLADKKIGDIEIVNYPWLYEPSLEKIKEKMLYAFRNPDEIKTIGAKAFEDAKNNWTWDNAFQKLNERITELIRKPIKRFDGEENDIKTSKETWESQFEENLSIDDSIKEIFKLVEKGKIDQAIPLIDKTIFKIEEEINFENKTKIVVSLNILKGKLYAELKNLIKAKESYEAVFAYDSTSSVAYAGLGGVFFSLNDYVTSKKMYDFSVKYDPQNETALKGLLKVNHRISLSAAYLAIEKEVIKENKLEKIFELCNNGKYTEALAFLNEHEMTVVEYLSKKEDAANLSAIYSLKGSLCLALNSYELAKDSFEKALHSNPVSSQACVGLGEIFFQLGQHDNAKIMFEWGVKNDPNNSAAIQSLSRVNEILGLEINHNSLMVEK
jgi:glycosyltransferase involved in cell wall biosynthesis/GT2 family glycosyltransferase